MTEPTVSLTMTTAQYRALSSLVGAARYHATEAAERKSWPARAKQTAQYLGRLADETGIEVGWR